MTKHGGTFKLSGETRDLLRKNREFFDQLTALNGDGDPDKIPLNILGKDPEARTEAKIQANGDVEVTFVYPVDDNSNPEDGRLYLRDTFLFDPSEQGLKSFNRSAEYNGKGQGNWQAWVEKYRAAFAANPLKADDEKVQKFAKTVARTFGRPITDENGATLPEIREVWVKDSSYITAANAVILKQREQDAKLPELKLKVKDKLNQFAVVPGEDSLELVFTFAVDADEDPANGRILLKDRFVLDPKTLALKEVKRSWELAPEASGNAEYQAYVDRLQQETGPTLEAGGKFLQDLLPVLLPGAQSDPVKALLAKPLGLPKDYRSPLARRLAADAAPLAETPAGAGEALDAMYAVAMDALAQRYDASLGWYNAKVKGRAPVDFQKEGALVQSVFQKAAEQSKQSPAANAFAALRALKLEGAEAALRERLLADPRLAQLDAIGRESDDKLRASQFLLFAREDLLKNSDFSASAVQILQRLAKVDSVKDEAERVLKVAAGQGSLGAKLEFLAPRFAKQVADPKMLAAMGAAPFLGVATEFAGLRAIGAFTKVGGAGRFAASLLGIGGEAFAFSAMHRGLESAFHDPSKFGVGFWKEVAGASFLFAGMRGAHAISGRFTRTLAEGKWGGLFGGKTAAEGAELMVSPTGRIFVDQASAKALTRTGRVVSAAANHLGGIGAMYASGALSRRLKWQADNPQSLGEHWFDAAVMYGQAAIGFGLANHLTGGRMQGNLAELKIRLSGAEKVLPELKAEKPKKDRPITLKPKTGTSAFTIKAGELAWKVDIKNLKRLWIGRGLIGREGVEYQHEEASLNVGDRYPDVNQYHAILLRDQANIFWYIADTGSTFGTYVNGKKLGAGEYVLAKPGDLVQLGDNFQFRLEPDGNLLEPHPGTTTIVQVPVPRSQKRLDPPKPADSFPFDVVFPDKSIPADANLEVGELKSFRDLVLPLRTGKPVWNLSLANGVPPIAKIYIDAKGRWVLQKLDPNARVETARIRPEGEKRWTLEKLTKDSESSQPGVGRQDWVFLEPRDQLFLQHQIFEFLLHPEPKDLAHSGEGSLVLPAPPAMEVPLHKVGEALDPHKPMDELPTAIRRRPGDMMFPNPNASVPGAPVPPPPPAREFLPTPIAGADLGPVEGDSELPVGDRPTLVGDYRDPMDDAEKTRPGIPVPIDMPTLFPQAFLEKIPEGQAPFVLVSSGGVHGLVADRQSTRYLLGSAPEVTEKNQVGVQVEGHRIDPNHAEIFLGRKAGGGEYQWFLSPDPNSEQGVYVDGFRKLDRGERIPLVPGRIFALGDQTGKRGGIQFSFEIPWLRTSNAPKDLQPASEFPVALLANLDSDMPAMTLRSNVLGKYFLRADRSTTRYVFGSGTAKPAKGTTEFVKLDSEKIAPEHCEIFIDAQGQWYLRALSDSHPTYLKAKLIQAGEVHPLTSGDPIELGGDAKEGIGLGLLFHKPEYLKPEAVSRAEPLPEDSEGDFELAGDDMMVGSSQGEEPVLELGPDMVKTVTPPPKPPPRKKAPVPPPLPPPQKISSPLMPPPPPGRGQAVARVPRVPPPPLPTVETLPGPATVSEGVKTGVFPVRADLLAQSALGDVEESAPPTVQRPIFQAVTARPKSEPPPPPAEEDDPTANWGREFAAEDEELSPKANSVPPPKPPSAPPPAAVAPEESFAGIAEEVLATPDPDQPATGAAQGDGIETVRAEPPRQVAVAPRRISLEELAQVDELRKIHPDLVSPAILPQVEPLLQSDRAQLRVALDTMKAFPQVSNIPNRLAVGSTEESGQILGFFTKVVGYDVGFESGKAAPGPAMSKEMQGKLIEMVGRYWLEGRLKNVYRLESDGLNLKFSSFSDKDGPKPDSMFALSLKPGSEVAVLEAVYRHFLTLGVPVEVVLPLSTQGMKTPYAGVYFRSEHASELLAAVRGLHGDSKQDFLDSRWMPFSHPVLDLQGKSIPGVGVMEFTGDQARRNPLEAKAFAVARAYNTATRYANQNSAGVIDTSFFRSQILQSFAELGVDLNNPGFNHNSVTGSHRVLAENSTPAPTSSDQ